MHALPRTFAVAVTVAVLVGCSTQERLELAELTPDGRSLSFSLSVCNADQDVDVREDEDVVAVSIRSSRGDGNDCADGVVVELDAPLGDRTVIDASTGDEVTVVRR